MGNPYVISAELDLANADLERIVRPENIEGFRVSLDANLRSLGKDTVWVESSTLQGGLKKAIGNTRLPVVSLDDRYVTSANAYIGISRGVDEQLNDDGYVPRVGYPSIANQLGKISSLGSAIVIADDVLFSGEMISWLADALEPSGVKIGGLVCGIAIQEGVEKMNSLGIDVEAVQTFEDVEDEICERDFAVVPGSGRRIDSLQSNALYFDYNAGKPDLWASLPARRNPKALSFEVNSFRRAADLLQAGVKFGELGRFYGFKNDAARREDATRVLDGVATTRLWDFSAGGLYFSSEDGA